MTKRTPLKKERKSPLKKTKKAASTEPNKKSLKKKPQKTSTDSIKRRRAEEELRVSEEKYRAIFEQAQDSIIIVQPETGGIVEFNNMMHENLGYTREEFRKIRLADIEVVEFPKEVAKHMKKVMKDGSEIFETRLRRKNGEIRNILVSTKYISIDGKNFFQSILRDITEHKRTKQQLTLMGEITKNITEGIALVRVSDGIIVYTNPKHEEMFGYGPGEMNGKHVTICNAPSEKSPEEISREITDDLNKKGEWQGEVKNIRKDGTTFWGCFHISTFKHHEHGDVWVGVCSDITESKRAEEEIQNKTRLLQLLQEVSVAANEAATVEEAMEICLEKVCSHTNWPVGHVYLCDRAGNLSPSTIWFMKDPEKFEVFRKVTRKTSFSLGVGLPGRVLRDGIPHWITDVTKDPGFLRTKFAKDIGVKGAFAFPVLERKKVVAVLEFFSEDVAAPDKLILDAITILATQLGRVTERKRAEKELHRSHEMLEVRVKERTEELIAINEELKSEIIERTRVEEALRQSEERIQRSFDNSAIGMSMVDANARFLKVNTALCNMVGYSEKELLNKTFQDLTHPDDLNIGASYMPRMFSGEIEKAEFEKRYIHKNGHTIWILITTSLIQDTQGQPPYFFTQTRDITERKKAEDELRKSEEILQSVTRNSSDYILTLDLDGKIEFLNKAAPGMKIKDMLGTDAATYIPEKYRPVMHKTLQRVRETGKPDLFEVECSPPNGNVMMLESRVSPVMLSGKVVSFVINAHDITERKQVLDSLKQSETSLSEAQKIAHVGSWSDDFRTGEILWSAETYRILGFKPGEITPSKEASLNAAHPDDMEKVQNAIEQTLSGTGPFNIEHRIIWKDGTERILNSRGEAEFDKDGKPIKIFGTSQDITEKKKLQQQLIHTEKLSSIGTFVSGVAHELNTPLSSILGYSQNLINIKNLPIEAIEEIEIISEQSKRAANIVRNLLKFSRKHRQGKTTVNINDVIESSLELHAFSLNTDHIRIVKQLSENLAPVNVNSHELQQVFTNIVLNAQIAMKILHGNGTLTIKTEEKDKKIFVIFENSGQAIPEERLKKIFDPFFTTKGVGEGTGLGLYVSYQIVKNHGGKIFAENIGKSGVRFIITLPAAVPVSKKPVRKQQPLALKNIKVLIVEDDEAFRRLLSKYLLGQGVFVQAATDGREAVKLIKESSFDVVLSDIKMPVMDGYGLGKWLKQNRPEYLSRFVLLTGVIEKKVEDFCAENNFKYIIKPTELNDILKTIQAVVG